VFSAPADVLPLSSSFENKGSMMGCSNPHPHGQVRSLLSHTLQTVAALARTGLVPLLHPHPPRHDPPIPTRLRPLAEPGSQRSSSVRFLHLPTPSSRADLSRLPSLSLHRATGKPCLLLNYAASELAKHKNGDEDSRVVLVGKHFVAVVPFWASWPFETMVIPFQ